MGEREAPFRPEAVERATPERYTLDRLTVEPITTPPNWPSERLRALPWPLELQGKGLTDERAKTLTVRYPRGDVFLSSVTTIHELGHLRQHEVNAALPREAGHARLVAEEQDAWHRGWERFAAANPDYLTTAEAKFQAHRRTHPALAEFATLADYYGWVRDGVGQIVEAQRVLFEDEATPRPEQLDRLADQLEVSGAQVFLERLSATRVGEAVDEPGLRAAIIKTVERVIEE